jgi:uncharacterized protein with GYD domain
MVYDRRKPKEDLMPKFLIEGSYTAEGLKGLAKEKASGRQAVLNEALASLGGKLEGIYYALGDADVYIFCDCPDHVSAAALSLAASSTGLVRTKTIALMTVEETDRALSMKLTYRAPGEGKGAKA